MDDEIAVHTIGTNEGGNVCPRRVRRRRQKQLITELISDYASNTTLHGIPYIMKKGLTMPEKIFWILTSIISICWCSVLIYQLWFRWRTSPVIVTISEEVVSVGTVPFPSVTICPQWKCKVSVYNYTDEMSVIKKLWSQMKKDKVDFKSSMAFQHMKTRNDVSQICGFNYFPTHRKYGNSSVIEHIVEVSPDTGDVFHECSLSGTTDVACDTIFKKVLTREGVCFTANSLSFDEIFRVEKIQDKYKYLYETKPIKGWTIEEGYNFSEPDPYPIHGIESGLTPDLTVVLKENTTDRDYLCNIVNTGFRVYTHHPSDLPQSSLYYYSVINKYVSSLALSFSILNTSESLRSYAPDTRQCYFPDERYLKYFRHYTAKNCWIECISNHTFKKCGCVEFYMPHNNSDQICAEDSYGCTIKSQEEMVRKESASANGCHCLPACISVDYEAEILKTEFNVKREYQAMDVFYKDNLTSQYKGVHFSKLEMYYKRPRFLSMRRSELFGTTEFLANCGGLLGLFMGFSFLTLAELVYYLTLRLWCTLNKDLKEEEIQTQMKNEDLKKTF